jgi:transposase-like protein
MAGKKGMKHYPLEFRQIIVDEHMNKGYTINFLTQKYSLSPSQVKAWCRWQKKYGIPKQVTGKTRGRPKICYESVEEELKRLRMENTVLKKYHELLLEEETKRK